MKDQILLLYLKKIAQAWTGSTTQNIPLQVTKDHLKRIIDPQMTLIRIKMSSRCFMSNVSSFKMPGENTAKKDKKEKKTK